MRTIIRKIHLWLGLITGPIVLIVALTGCIYAFQEEIQNLTQPYRFVEKQDKAYLPPSELRDIAEKELPGKHLHAIMYIKEGYAAKAIFYSFNEYYFIVYINPYSGEILKTHDVENSFFGFILEGHFYLWLPKHIGQPVVAISTLLFFILLISGLLLWWPRNKYNLGQKFKIKFNGSWKRKNYDLHSVIGFYASFIALILIITGLVWGFEWFRNSYYYTISGGEKYIDYYEPDSDTTQNVQSLNNEVNAIDKVWAIMKKEYPQTDWIEIHLPETSESPIAANTNEDQSTYWKIDYRYFDQYTLKELSVDHQWGRLDESDFGQTLMRMNYDIHVGGIFGLWGKTLMFFVSLLIASLPVTGFLIWYGRKFKVKKQKLK